MIIVTALATHVDHAVNGRAPAQHLASGVANTPTVQARVWLNFVAPVGTGIVDGVEITHRDIDPKIVVFLACLNQQDIVFTISSEPVSQNAARGAGANNNIIEGSHVTQPPQSAIQVQPAWRRYAVPSDYQDER